LQQSGAASHVLLGAVAEDESMASRRAQTWPRSTRGGGRGSSMVRADGGLGPRSGSRRHPHPRPAARDGRAWGDFTDPRHSRRRVRVAGATAAAKDSAAERGTLRRPTPRRWRAAARPPPMALDSGVRCAAGADPPPMIPSRRAASAMGASRCPPSSQGPTVGRREP